MNTKISVLAVVLSIWPTLTFAMPVLVNDPNIFYTPENWIGPSLNSVETSSPGAYLKMGFSGTSFTIVVDTSSFIKNPDSTLLKPATTKMKKRQRPALVESYNHGEFDDGMEGITEPAELHATPYAYELPKIGYQVDNGPIHWRVVPTAAKSVSMLLLSGLPPGSHQIRISLEGLGKNNRWVNPTDVLKINNFVIDDGAATLAPALLPKRMIVYGDSITEGDDVYANANVVANKEWSETWDARLADRLDAEVSVIAYQAQGYTQPGEGLVPSFMEAYANVREGVKRHFSKPDYVFVLEGTNGVTLQSDVESMIAKLRTAYPAAKLFFSIPFNQNASWDIEGAFAEHWKQDANLHEINLSGDGFTTVAQNSNDQIHPSADGHRLLAEMIYRQIYVYVKDSVLLTTSQAPAKTE